MEDSKKAKFIEAAPTKEWLNLFLGGEIGERCKVVYQKIEGEPHAKFLELWSPDKEYDGNCVIVPVSSTYGGYTLLSQGTCFKNVSGSTKDPNHYGTSWIQMMRLVYEVLGADIRNLEVCCSTPDYHEIQSGNDKIHARVHNGVIVGGHVYVQNEGDQVFLLPICMSHNALRADNCYMTLARDTLAINLANYLM